APIAAESTPPVRSSRAPEPAPPARVSQPVELPAWDQGPAAGQRPPPTEAEADQRTTDEGQSAAAARPSLGDLRDTLTDGAERLREGAEGLLQRVRPERDAVARRSYARELSLSARALVAIALAIPLVTLVLVVLTRLQYERARDEQFRSLQTLAQARYDSATRMSDRALQREELYRALDKVSEGQKFSPTDETLDALERTILHKLDDVDVVARLYHYWKLLEFSDGATSFTDSSRIVIRDTDVFVLNRGSGRVYKLLLNEAGDALQSVGVDPVLVQKGELRSGVRLGDMVDICWLAAGDQRTISTFVVLERAGSLLAYDPQMGLDVLPMADSDRWLKPQAIGGYFGNLYVLDPLVGYIFKYVPTDNAYTNPPGYYINPQFDMDLTGAVDMAIDGNLYVLFADGRVSKFLNGEPRPFSLAGLPSPMVNPTTIFVSGEQKPEAEGWVYVTDTGNERIVQFDKNGIYVRQFRDRQGDDHLRGLRGVYVDEGRSRMFVLSDKTLWLTQLPPRLR
ncbi:MAG: hypothetical protein V1772_12035, partial [Chloroflexota bacterium]